MRVTFTADVLHETIGRGQGQLYEAGSTHDLREDYAHKWVSQGVAVFTVDKPEPIIEPEPVVEIEVADEEPEPEIPRRRGRPPRS